MLQQMVPGLVFGESDFGERQVFTPEQWQYFVGMGWHEVSAPPVPLGLADRIVAAHCPVCAGPLGHCRCRPPDPPHEPVLPQPQPEPAPKQLAVSPC